MILIIGFSGKLGSGKDTLGEAMIATAKENNFQVYRRGAAEALKQEAAAYLAFHSPYQVVQHVRRFEKDKDQGTRIIKQLLQFKKGSRLSLRDYRGTAVSDIVEAMCDRSRKEQYREWLIFWGTEYRRVHFGLNYWLDQLRAYMKDTEARHPEENLLFYVPDVRFTNEAEFIQNELGGYLVRVERPDLASSGITHPSETELDGYKLFNMTVLNTATLEIFQQHGPLVFLQALAWKAGAANVSPPS